MNVHPAIQALRGDWVSQRRAQAALMEAFCCWRSSGQTRQIETDLRAYGQGADLENCASLDSILADHRSAMNWVRELIFALIPAMHKEPLGDLPLNFSSSDGFATIQILSHGRATLNLSAHQPRPGTDQPEAVLLVDRESTELLLHGNASGVFCRSEMAGGDNRKFSGIETRWAQGDQIKLTRGDARHIFEFDQTILTLQLVRTAEKPLPTRKYRLSDGSLIHSASGDKQASRDLMALGVLGLLPSDEAFDVMRWIATDAGHPPDLRWEAVRQVLGADPAKGVELLHALSLRFADPLATHAVQLKSHLFSAHPQLAELHKEAA